MTPIDPVLKTRLEIAFRRLSQQGAQRIPAPASLAYKLERSVPATGVVSISVRPEVAAMFATAAVEVWGRAIHTFLISAALTDASPIWASIAGYYASHYCIRGLAHLLGHFHLHRRKHSVILEIQHGGHLCTFHKGQQREHQFYWKTVRQDPHFASDPLFTENNESVDRSDASHRNRASYGDHLSQFPPQFRPLQRQSLIDRVTFISRMEFGAPPIPHRSRFPDLESVQVVAYQRIVKFRRFLDEVLGGGYRFWSIHRSPPWTEGIVDFQLVEQGTLASAGRS